MNLAEMRVLVRRDLHDEDSANYRWTDNAIDRHLAHALKVFSEYLPLEQKAVVATVPGSREISISGLSSRVMIKAVEYPAGRLPPKYQRFSLWNDTLTLQGEEIPDGSDCIIYYGKLHTLDVSGSTIPAQFEDLIATGACGNASLEMAFFTINRVNSGGTGTPEDLERRGLERLAVFLRELKRLGRRNRVRISQLYS
jgi:hypothetical protein